MTPLWKQRGSYWTSPITPDNLVVFNILGAVTPGDDAGSLAHCAYNRAAPVFLTPEGRGVANRKVVGAPVVMTDAFEFAPGTGVVNAWAETDEWCEYVLAAVTDTGIGSGSQDRAVISGSRENTQSRGYIFYAQTGTSMRAYAYDASGVLAAATVSVPDTVAKWRWWYYHCKATGGGDYEVRVVNLTGDSVTDESAVTMTGHSPGINRDAVGGAYGGFTKKGRVSIRARFDTPHDETQRAAVLASLRAVAAERSIVELATAT